MTDDEIKKALSKEGLAPEAANELAGALIDLLHKARLHHSCISCAYFYEHHENPTLHEHCSKFGQRPPARVIAIGCQFWEEPIPF